MSKKTNINPRKIQKSNSVDHKINSYKGLKKCVCFLIYTPIKNLPTGEPELDCLAGICMIETRIVARKQLPVMGSLFISFSDRLCNRIARCEIKTCYGHTLRRVDAARVSNGQEDP